MLLNFSDRTRTGAFSMIWPLAENYAGVIAISTTSTEYILKLLQVPCQILQVDNRFTKDKFFTSIRPNIKGGYLLAIALNIAAG